VTNNRTTELHRPLMTTSSLVRLRLQLSASTSSPLRDGIFEDWVMMSPNHLLVGEPPASKTSSATTATTMETTKETTISVGGSFDLVRVRFACSRMGCERDGEATEGAVRSELQTVCRAVPCSDVDEGRSLMHAAWHEFVWWQSIGLREHVNSSRVSGLATSTLIIEPITNEIDREPCHRLWFSLFWAQDICSNNNGDTCASQLGLTVIMKHLIVKGHRKSRGIVIAGWRDRIYYHDGLTYENRLDIRLDQKEVEGLCCGQRPLDSIQLQRMQVRLLKTITLNNCSSSD